MLKLKAVVFDYGNVLSLPQDPDEIAAMAAILSADISLFNELYWRFRLPYDRGELEAREYWSSVAEGCMVSLTDEKRARLIQADNRSWSRPSRPVLSWVQPLRESGMLTAILSNMPLDLRRYLDESCDWLPEFEHRTFSCEVSSAKPEPDIYRHCLKGLGVEPEETLFLDDRADNVQAGAVLGMQAVLFTTPSETLPVLQERFQLPLSAPSRQLS